MPRTDELNSPSRLRQQIAFEAARLMHEGREDAPHAAKIRAARSLTRCFVKPHNLPTDADISAALAQFETVHFEPPESDLETPDDSFPDESDPRRFTLWRSLLQPLERVRMPKRTHPESDGLFHSLQVFVLAKDAEPYDEEFQTAALLHDVGWAIDPWAPTPAGLEALGPSISVRTRWLIEHLPEANNRRSGKLGTRARNRLTAAEDGELLFQLSDLDLEGRRPGATVPTLDDALASIETPNDWAT